MKRRKTRFNDGGANNPYQGDDVDPYSAARDEAGNIAVAKDRDLKAEIKAMQEAEKEPAPARAQTFKEAFAGARGAGKKTFEWQGKRYTTELAAPKKAADPAPAASSSSGSTSGGARSSGKGGATADEMRRYYGAGRGGATADEMRRYYGAGRGGATADEMRREYDRRETERQMGRGAGRAPESSGRSSGIGGATADEMRRRYDGSRATGRGGATADEMRRFYESKDFRKGGGVKAKKMASGGMTSKVSSASKRADGCAQRGKTRGKMY
jgi:hypothetical protein